MVTAPRRDADRPRVTAAASSARRQARGDVERKEERTSAEVTDVKLIIQPDAGVVPVVQAVQRAKKSIDICIFRFDRAEIEQALEAAVRAA